MSAVFLPVPYLWSQVFTDAGVVGQGYQIFIYQAGTTVPITTFTDATLTSQNPNPFQVSSNGRLVNNTGGTVEFWVPSGTVAKIFLTDQTNAPNPGVPITGGTFDNIAGINDINPYPRTAGEIAAGITPTNTSYPPGQFERYGATGNNVTDDSAAVTMAFLSGSVVTGIQGTTYYCGTSTLTLSAPFRASLNGVALRTAVNGTTFLNITASTWEITGAEIYGRGNSSYVSLERLIQWNGTGSAVAAPFYLTDARLTNCYLHDVGERGFYSEFGQRCVITNCRFLNIGYAAITGISAQDWQIIGGLIDTVSPGTSGNAYGVSFSRITNVSDNLTFQPRSNNCKVIGMTVKNNPTWEAFDTHGGSDISFVGCIAENVKIGVAIGSCPGIAGTALFGPKNCKSIGNTLTNSTPVSGGFGVGINGAGTVTGTVIDAAEGCQSVGDKVTGFGVTAAGTAGGYQFSYTNALVVDGCTANQCFPNSFVFYHDNYGFTVSGCTAIDPYDSTVTNCSGIMLNAGYNTGQIGGNSFIRQNTALGTTVGAYAINMLVSTSSTVAVGSNYSTFTTYETGISGFAVTPLTDSTGGTPSSTIVAVPAGYTQATLANQLSSLTSAINTIETALRNAGLMA